MYKKMYIFAANLVDVIVLTDMYIIVYNMCVS